MPTVLIKDLDNTEKGPSSDMKLYFNHTFVKVCPDGKGPAVWAKYSGGDDEDHIFHTLKGTLKVPYKHPSATVEWTIPTGWFNTKRSAVFSERMPKRQYFKGLYHGHNVSFSTAETVLRDQCSAKDEKAQVILQAIAQSKSFIFGLGSVEELFSSPIYPEFGEAYVMMKAKKAFSRALSQDFALLPHPTAKDFLVFCHDMAVAEVLTKNKIKMLVPAFKPECSEFFQKEGIVVV